MSFTNKPITRPQRLLGEALLISASKHPQKTVLIVNEKEYSYERLKRDALKLAEVLIERGVKKGDRIAVYMDNSWESAVSVYGISLAGAVFLVINPQTKADKLQYILNDSEAGVLISHSKMIMEISEIASGLNTLRNFIIAGIDKELPEFEGIKVEAFESVMSKSPDYNHLDLPAVIPNDLASLIYTSGSTGFPKGVMMTHQSMVFTSWSLLEYLRIMDQDRIILVLPLAFDYGLYQLLMAVTAGASLVIPTSFIFLGNIFRQITEKNVTVFPGVPTTYAMMIASYKSKPFSFDGIKKVTNTAAALPAEHIPLLKKIFPNALIFKMYGLTECKRVSYLEPELLDKKIRSVGKAIPGTEVFIRTADGKEAGPDEPGTLYVRGPHVMVGYWKQEEKTAKMLKPGKLPGERILCTHDLFKMDEDGFLYFLGRSDDIIKTRGEKVSPLEVENVLIKMEDIREAAVIGVPDEVQGESIKAFVSVKEGSGLSEKGVRKFCNANLESFMVPERIVFLPELPKSANRKVDKKKLKEDEKYRNL